MSTGTVLQVAMVLLGMALIVRTIAAGGGALAVGVIVGLLFVAAGGLRLWADRR